jgi:hypothetical protein
LLAGREFEAVSGSYVQAIGGFDTSIPSALPFAAGSAGKSPFATKPFYFIGDFDALVEPGKATKRQVTFPDFSKVMSHCHQVSGDERIKPHLFVAGGDIDDFSAMDDEHIQGALELPINGLKIVRDFCQLSCQ